MLMIETAKNLNFDFDEFHHNHHLDAWYEALYSMLGILEKYSFAKKEKVIPQKT